MIEVEVHQHLRTLLREQPESMWAHHLTMARLIARALRLGRSALIQTGTTAGYDAPYRLSYLLPILLWPEPVLLITPIHIQTHLLTVEFPRLQQWLQVSKPVQIADPHWTKSISPHQFPIGVLLATPEQWLRDRLENRGQFPEKILTLIDGVDNLETQVRTILNVQIQPQHWDHLALHYPQHVGLIRDLRVRFTHQLFQHPPNPINSYLIEPIDRTELLNLLAELQTITPLPFPWTSLIPVVKNSTLWATVNRTIGTFTLTHSPLQISDSLRSIWKQQPTVLIGSALDLDASADTYRATHGLDDLTCLKFAPPRQEAGIHLYQPEGIPMPNTPQYQPALLKELRHILTQLIPCPAQSSSTQQLLSNFTLPELSSEGGWTVILVGDTPLRDQVGAQLASEWGSRVQVDRIPTHPNGILVAGWDYWQSIQPELSRSHFPAPRAIIIATLPMPSLEHPLVSARVQHYKSLRQDWFRLYLLPTALMDLSRAILSVRESRGLVALLDSRVLHRNYGQQVLTALSPYARVHHLDQDWMSDFEPLRDRFRYDRTA